MSYRGVALHALTVYYDGDAALAGKVLDGMTADAYRVAADALDRSPGLLDFTDDHMGDVYATTNELRRMADGLYPEVPQA